VTGPYGHAGGYTDLRAVIAHHANPSDALQNYALSSAFLPNFAGADDSRVVTDSAETSRIAQALGERPTYALTEGEIDLLLAFLASLEDTQEGRGRLGVPESVPSGLALDQ
jgi:cytochrome c peroxidase